MDEFYSLEKKLYQIYKLVSIEKLQYSGLIVHKIGAVVRVLKYTKTI